MPGPRKIIGRFAALLAASPRIVAFVLRAPAGDRRIRTRALVVLLCVEVAIRWAKLPTMTRVLGIRFEPSLDGHAEPTHAASHDVGPREPDVERARATAVGLLRRWPLGTGPCLRESLVLGRLLRTREPQLRLGIERAPSGVVRAHAWIEVDERPVNDPLGYIPFARARS